MEVRRVRADQWAELREIRLRALADAPDAFETRLEEAIRRSDDWWVDWAARSAEGDEQAMFLAWHGGAPVGVVGAYVEERRCRLISMWVDPSSRGRGLGAALVYAVVEFAAAAGHTELGLAVRLDNERALRLYARCGFLDTGDGVAERELRLAL